MADGKKTVTIIVEGTPHEWPKEEITSCGGRHPRGP